MTKSELMARLAELFIENNEGTELQAKDIEYGVKVLVDTTRRALGAIRKQANEWKCPQSACPISNPARNCASAWIKPSLLDIRLLSFADEENRIFLRYGFLFWQ